LLLVTSLHAGAWWWSHHRERETVTPAIVPQMVEVELMSTPQPVAVASPEPPAPTPPAKPEPKPRQPDPKPVVKPPPKKVTVPPKPKAPTATETDDLAHRLRQLKESLGREAPRPESAASAAPSRPVAKPSGGGARSDQKATSARADHLHNPKPPYPAVARARNWEGVSRLRVYVLPNGSAGQVQLAGSSGHDVLDNAALAAVRSWRFVPAKRGDQAIASWVQFPIVWKLQ
jgi:protein TonB